MSESENNLSVNGENNSQLPAVVPQPDTLARHRLPRVRHVKDDDDAAPDIGPQFLLRAALQWWRYALPVGLILAAAVGAWLWTRFEPVYSAFALIEIPRVAPWVAFQEGNEQSGSFVATQIERIRGPIVLGPVLAKPEIARLADLAGGGDPLTYLEAGIRVRQVGRSDIYRIEFTAKDPRGARDIVNAILDEYLTMLQELEFARRHEVIGLLQDEQTLREPEIRRMRRDLVEMAKEVTGGNPLVPGAASPDVDPAFSTVASLRSRLVEVTVRREELKAQLQAQESAQGIAGIGPASRQLMEFQLNQDPQIVESERQIDQLRMWLDERRRQQQGRGFGVSWNPDQEYLQGQAQLYHLEAQLSTLRSELRQNARQETVARQAQGRQQRIDQIKNSIVLADETYNTLKEKYDQALSELQDMGGRSVELLFAREDVAYHEDVFRRIAARKLALQTEMNAPERVEVRHRPAVPQFPVESVPWKHLLVACSVAFALPFGAAVAYELMARRIADADQLQDETQLQIVGEIARYPSVPVSRNGSGMPRSTRRDLGIVTECIDGLRTTLMLMDRLPRSGVLVVTSAASGEGKTTVATQLAMNIARSTGERTLLIDADTRSPDVHKLLNSPLSPGLAEVMHRKCKTADAIHRVNGNRLYVLPAGKLNRSPHDALKSKQVEKLLSNLRSAFTYIVVDSPPVLSASESLVLARHADWVLLSSMRDVSRARQVQAAVERLSLAGANFAGAVLNGTPVRTYLYRYGGYPYES